MLKRIILIVFIAVVGSGCATRSQFIYNHPSDAPEPHAGSIVAVMSPLNDLREGNKDIDKIFSTKPIEEIQKILHEELMSTRYFKEITFLEDTGSHSGTGLQIMPSLTQMEWEVPDYKEKLDKAFITSLLTGGIGGIIYGSTKTDVYGNTSLHVKLIENTTGKILIDKEYKGHCEEKLTKMSCDTSETKAKMVGNALKMALASLKNDLKEALGDSIEDAVSSADTSNSHPQNAN